MYRPAGRCVYYCSAVVNSRRAINFVRVTFMESVYLARARAHACELAQPIARPRYTPRRISPRRYAARCDCRELNYAPRPEKTSENARPQSRQPFRPFPISDAAAHRTAKRPFSFFWAKSNNPRCLCNGNTKGTGSSLFQCVPPFAPWTFNCCS